MDLDAIVHNLRFLRSRLAPDTVLMAVVKADAYGHGAVPVARAAAAAGAEWLGVATVSEGLALRRAGITLPILVLGYAPPAAARAAAEADLALTVFTLDSALAASAAGESLGRVIALHVKVDTGMGRIGIAPGDAVAFVGRLRDLAGVAVRGVFTHFARADERDPEPTGVQLARFETALAGLERAGLTPPLRHAANTAAILSHPESHFDMVRAGIGIYGCSPGEGLGAGLQPALRLAAQVVQVRRVPAGTAVGYGGTHVTAGPTEIATLPVGYADGYIRSLGSRAWVSFGDRAARVVGRVNMDQITVDVGGAGVSEGDVATLVGSRPTADEVAAWAGTISYELLCGLSPRLPRLYHRGGEIVDAREP